MTRSLIVLAALAGIAMAAPAQAEDKAWDDCASTDSDRVIDGCGKVIARGAKEPAARRATAYRSRAYSLMLKSDYARSVADYDEAIRLETPPNAELYAGRGYAYQWKGDHDHAIADFTEALRLDPRSAHKYELRARSHEKKGDLARALADYEAGLKLRPDDKDLIAGRDRTRTALGKGAPAAASGQGTKTPSPDGGSGRMSLADATKSCDVKLSDNDRIIAACTVMIERGPAEERSSYFHRRALAFKSKRDSAKALADYSEAIRLGSNWVLLSGRADLYVEVKDYDRAIDDYTSAIKGIPDFFQLYRQRGDALLLKGDPRRALADYDKALSLKPGDEPAVAGRGKALAALGSPPPAPPRVAEAPAPPSDGDPADCKAGAASGTADRVIAGCSKLLERGSREPAARRAAALLHRGDALLVKGEHDRAIADFDRAIGLRPGDAAAYVKRASAYAKAGDHDQALADYGEAIRLDPNNAAAHLGRGHVLLTSGKLDGALDDYEAAARIDPSLLKDQEDPVLERMEKQFEALIAALKAGETDRLFGYADRFAQLFPDPGVFRAIRAVLLTGRGDLDGALAEAEALIGHFGKEIYGLRAIVRIARGEFKDALGDLDALGETDLLAEMLRAAARQGSGDATGALAAYRRAVEAKGSSEEAELVPLFLPRETWAHSLLGIVKRKSGDLAAALAASDRAVARDPRSVIARIERAATHEARGSIDLALADYQAALAEAPGLIEAKASIDRLRPPATRPIVSQPETPAVARIEPPKSEPAQPPTAVTPPETRVALVIGNGAYAALTPLPNPPNDARDMAAALKDLGFAVTLLINATRAQMEDRLAAFSDAARKADVALTFYAGHGLQHEGVNYLAPIDAHIARETDLRKLIRVQDLIDDLQNARSARILLLDACRDNEAIRALQASLPRSRSAGVRSGLAATKAEGLLIAYATQANTTAADGGDRNSPFTAALLKHIGTPGQELRTMLTRVRGEVLKATGGVQRPEVADLLDGLFEFR